MNKLALFSFIKDEIDLIEDFLNYHIPIFDEITIIDSGSKDGTLEVINKYASENNNIKVISADICFSAKDEVCSDLMRKSGCDILVGLDADEIIVYDNGSVQKGNLVRNYLQRLPITGAKYKICNSYEYNPFNKNFYGKNPHTKIIFPQKTFMYTDGGFHRGRTTLDENFDFDSPVYWRKFLQGLITTDKVIDINISYIHYHYKTKEIWLKNTIKKLKSRLGEKWNDPEALKNYNGPSIHVVNQYLKFLKTGEWFKPKKKQIFFDTDSGKKIGKPINFRKYDLSTNSFSYMHGGEDLQQFIGINDKNMKPIYERDVVKGIYGLEGIEIIGEVQYSCDRCAYVVDWNYEISNIELDSLEIVGNMDKDYTYNEQGELTKKLALSE